MEMWNEKEMREKDICMEKMECKEKSERNNIKKGRGVTRKERDGTEKKKSSEKEKKKP